jgi:hypothetical protein
MHHARPHAYATRRNLGVHARVHPCQALTRARAHTEPKEGRERAHARAPNSKSAQLYAHATNSSARVQSATTQHSHARQHPKRRGMRWRGPSEYTRIALALRRTAAAWGVQRMCPRDEAIARAPPSRPPVLLGPSAVGTLARSAASIRPLRRR